MELNLNKIKVAIFDFDDTLAIHKDKDYIKKRNESEEYLLNYFYKAYLNPTEFYEKIEPCIVSNDILKFIKKLRKNNVKIYCVSGMRFSFHLEAKKHFVHKYYGDDIEVFSARNQEVKVDAVKIIAKMNNCKLDEILFVDDLKENIPRFRNAGIKAILPEEVNSLKNEKY